MRDPQTLPGILQIGTDQERLSGADHVFREGIPQFPFALGENTVVANLEFEADLVRFLKRDVEIAGVKDLTQFNLDGAENFVLIEARADGFPDLCKGFVFFGAPVRVMTQNVVPKSKSESQREPEQQRRGSGREIPGLGLRENTTRQSVWAGREMLGGHA